MLALAPLTAASADTVSETIPVTTAARVIAATPDGSKVVTVGLTSTVSVLDVATGIESTPVAFSSAAYNIAITPDGALAVVPVTDGSLLFVDTATGAVSVVTLGVYAFDIAISLDGSLAYVTTGGALVTVVDLSTRTPVGSLLVGGSGYGIALAPDGASLFVTDIFSNSITSVDIATGLVIGTVPGGSLPTEVVARSDGRLYVGSFANSTVGTVDPAVGVFTPIALSGPGPISAIALTPDGSRLYVPRGFGSEVAIIDTATNTQTGAVATGVDVNGIAISADGTTAFTGDTSTPAVLVIAIDRPPLLAATAPAATISTPYTFAAGTGGSPTPTYSISAGSLPTGLALDTATGVVSGTPTVLGASAFSITATNALGSATQAYSITVAAAALLPAAGTESLPLIAAALALLALGLVTVRRAQSRQGTSGTR